MTVEIASKNEINLMIKNRRFEFPMLRFNFPHRDDDDDKHVDVYR